MLDRTVGKDNQILNEDKPAIVTNSIFDADNEAYPETFSVNLKGDLQMSLIMEPQSGKSKMQESGFYPL